MADNHSPYDPDPRQGRGGDRRTQALQAVSLFLFKKPAFHFVRSSQIAMGPDPSPFCRRGRIGATSARRLHHRHHTPGSMIERACNRNGPKITAAFDADDLSLRIHGNCLISGQRWRTRAVVLLRTPRTCQEKSRRPNNRTTCATSTSSTESPSAPRIDEERPTC